MPLICTKNGGDRGELVRRAQRALPVHRLPFGLLLLGTMSALVALAHVLVAAVATVLVAWKILPREDAGDRPCAVVLEHERVVTALDSEEAHLPPVLPPAVAHMPVRDVVLHAPAHDGHDVVHLLVLGPVLGVLLQDAAIVVVQMVRRRHAASDGPALVYL